MKAVTIEPGGVLVIREHPTPTPGVGEVLVRTHAAGLNNADLGQRAGLYPAPPGSPADILAWNSQARSPRSGRTRIGSLSATE